MPVSIFANCSTVPLTVFSTPANASSKLTTDFTAVVPSAITGAVNPAVNFVPTLVTFVPNVDNLLLNLSNELFRFVSNDG